MSLTAWRALLAGVGLMISGVLPAFLTASLASRIPADFAFGNSGLGLAIAIFHVMCAVCSTPAGRLVERIGPVPTIVEWDEHLPALETLRDQAARAAHNERRALERSATRTGRECTPDGAVVVL